VLFFVINVYFVNILIKIINDIWLPSFILLFTSMFLIRTNCYELLEIWQQMDGWIRNSVIHQHSNILKLWFKAKLKEYETFWDPNIWFPNNIGGFKFKAFFKDEWNYFKDETQLMKNRKSCIEFV